MLKLVRLKCIVIVSPRLIHTNSSIFVIELGELGADGGNDAAAGIGAGAGM